MTKKVIYNNSIENATENFHELSIQVGLNGLSFSILDTISNRIIQHGSCSFENESSPNDLDKHLEDLLGKHGIIKRKFSDVIVVHRNNLFNLVPKSLFIEDELANYLKFNAKILANDHIDFDEIGSHDIVNIYVPFTNVNNLIYGIFGEFEFLHHSSIMVQALLNNQKPGKGPLCYVHITDPQMDLTVISHKKLLFHNSFNYATQEDFLYYLLFTLEQLQLDPDNVPIKLFGSIEEDDAIYELCHRYARNVSIFDPPTSIYPLNVPRESIDLTILNNL